MYNSTHVQKNLYRRTCFRRWQILVYRRENHFQMEIFQIQQIQKKQKIQKKQ